MRVENLIGNSTPDVLCINRRGVVFWIENKALEAWPVRAETKPLRTAFEPGQLAFGRDWRNWRGLSFVLLRVGLEYYLLNPDDPLDSMTKHELMTLSMNGKKEIIEYLEGLNHR